MKFILPDNLTLQRYNKLESTKFKLILNLIKQNKILKKISGILMPRLMTGNIDIKSISISL